MMPSCRCGGRFDFAQDRSWNIGIPDPFHTVLADVAEW